ncbi:MAG: hypothetical protein RLZZ444_3634, partial [Pseudomonadota bacterium]
MVMMSLFHSLAATATEIDLAAVYVPPPALADWLVILPV